MTLDTQTPQAFNGAPTLDEQLHQALIQHAQAREALAEVKAELVEKSARLTAFTEREAAIAALTLEQVLAEVELEIRQQASAQGAKLTEQHIRARVVATERVQEAERASLEAAHTVRLVKAGGHMEVVICQRVLVYRQKEVDLAASAVEALRARIALPTTTLR